ncbi:MAG: hypothetical protein AAGA54_26790 [Myxococcota bacterium]
MLGGATQWADSAGAHEDRFAALEQTKAPLVNRDRMQHRAFIARYSISLVTLFALVGCNSPSSGENSTEASTSAAHSDGAEDSGDASTGQTDQSTTLGPTSTTPSGTVDGTATSNGSTSEDTSDSTGTTAAEDDSTGGARTDPCLVPPGQFVSLSADGLRLGRVTFAGEEAVVEPLWSFEREQVGIEVDAEGNLVTLSRLGAEWYVEQHCFEDGTRVDDTLVLLESEGPISSFTLDPDGVPVLIAPALTPKSDGELDKYTLDRKTGTMTPYPLGSIYCDIDDVEFVFPLIEFNPNVEEWPNEREFAIANDQEQILGASPIGTCVNYSGGYATIDGVLQPWTSMDYDPSDYDDFFGQAVGLWGLSPMSQFYYRDSLSTGDAELRATATEALRAFAIGPAPN